MKSQVVFFGNLVLVTLFYHSKNGKKNLVKVVCARACLSVSTCEDLRAPVEEACAVIQFARHTDTQSDCRVEVGSTDGT